MSLSNILLIPGVGGGELSQLKSLLFGQGQAGGIWVPSLSPTMISSESFGTGVQTFLDLSGNGKNATQASSGSRPAWGRVPKSGKVNLLTYSEDITQSVYSAALGATVLTESSVEFTDVNSLLTNEFPALLGQVTFSVELRCENPVTIRLRGRNDGVNTATLFGEVAVNSDWTRFSGTATGTGAGITQVGIQNNTDGATRTIEIRKLQINTGATAGPYQKVTTAFDITESGQRDCYYLQPDGVDDLMLTPAIDLSASNQITIFAALRKFTDANRAVYAWQRSATSLFSSSISIEAPNTNGANNYRLGVNFGTIAGSTATAVAPTTNVLTGTADGVNGFVDLRMNGVSARFDINLGAGFATNEPFGLFHRPGSNDLHWPGQCFGVILAAGVYPTSTIQKVERILSRYTPGVSL